MQAAGQLGVPMFDNERGVIEVLDGFEAGYTLDASRRVYKVDIRFMKERVSELIEYVASQNSVVSLDIAASNVTDTHLKQISGISRLRELTIATDESMAHSADALGALTNLINLEEFAYFGDLRGKLKHFGRLKNLKRIALHRSSVDDVDMETLGQLDRLERVTVASNGVTGRFLSAFTKGHGMSSLAFEDGGFGDAAARVLHRFPRLTQLYVNGTQITDVGLAQIGKCERLEVLALDNTAISAAGLAVLPVLLNLRRLTLEGCHISDRDAMGLIRFPKLTSLVLGQATNERAVIDHFAKHLPNCDVVIPK